MKKAALIFVVDDDVLIQKIISAELKKLKAEVMVFSYGEDCLKELHLKPDLLILDYIFADAGRPRLSGLEILKEIRKEHPDLPVIILSGQESGNTVLELMKLDIEEYIIKEKEFSRKVREAAAGIINRDKS
ncbi:MAG: response regulator [Bacteroidales bacterium]|nr:response regulator [Bacteroidales bacterium]MCB8998482.1 response regulator [Bacteroidales bacterium]MCB9012923.1 response regulator [Bacteroidales bacterium]